MLQLTIHTLNGESPFGLYIEDGSSSRFYHRKLGQAQETLKNVVMNIFKIKKRNEDLLTLWKAERANSKDLIALFVVELTFGPFSSNEEHGTIERNKARNFSRLVWKELPLICGGNSQTADGRGIRRSRQLLRSDETRTNFEGKKNRERWWLCWILSLFWTHGHQNFNTNPKAALIDVWWAWAFVLTMTWRDKEMVSLSRRPFLRSRRKKLEDIWHLNSHARIRRKSAFCQF